MAEEVKKLRRLRGGLKGGLTKVLADFDDFVKSSSNVQLKAKKQVIENALEKMDKYNETVYDLLENEDELEHEMTENFNYREKIGVYLGLIQERLSQSVPNVINNKASHESGYIKLPKLTLPTFSGDVSKWLGFWELFQCSVHCRTDLTDIQKFTYLKGQLTDEALQLIDGFSLEAGSYEPAIRILKETYGQEDRIKAVYVANFYGMERPAHNVSELKAFYAAAECTIESMRTMQTTLNEMLAIMVHNKLPSSLSEIIKRELKDNWLDIDEYLRVLKNEIANMETRSSPIAEYKLPAATATFTLNQSSKSETKVNDGCKLCQRTGHFWMKCSKYKTGVAKNKRASQLKLCTGCLANNHGSQGCINPKIKPCKICNGKHYYCLCTAKKNQSSVNNTTASTSAVATATAKRKQSSVNNTTASTSDSAVAMATIQSKTTVMLPTIKIPLKGSSNRTTVVRALLDQCSQKTFILRSSLPLVTYTVIGKEALQLQGFTGELENEEYDVISLCFKHRRNWRQMTAVVVDSLPTYKMNQGLTTVIAKCKALGNWLADPDVTADSKMEMLIGADHYYDFVHAGYKRVDNVILLPTIYGYALSGRYQSPSEGSHTEVVTVLKLAVSPVEVISRQDETPTEIKDLTALWELDHIGIKPQEIKKEEEQTMVKFMNTVNYDEEKGQYEVQLPWKTNSVNLPDNFQLALGRLRGLQRKFISKPNYYTQYSNVLKEQEERGFIEKVDMNAATNQPCHYLAHHGVEKESSTTPVRIVFDCSAKTNTKSLSLNDCLYTGPSLVSDLTQMLLRFRLHKYAWISDIEKAFLMVALHHNDRDATRFLWPVDPLDLTSPYIIYRFKVVLFGATCSQFLLNATIRKHLTVIEEDPDLICKLERGLYIDNLQGTGNNGEELREQCWDAQRVFSKAHLFLKEWVTNCSELREFLHVNGMASAEHEKVKVLGLYWLTEKDVLTYNARLVHREVITKRQALSITASIFDPLGLLLPVTIRARRFIQHLWRIKCNWDDPVTETLQTGWQELMNDLIDSTKITISRQVTVNNEVVLHLFSDASSVAYGAVAYITSGGTCKLVMARAKIAPMKPMTIPKMELTAVLIAARMYTFIEQAYAHELKIQSVYIWTDSQVTLHWLQSQKPLPVYVQNRVDEIFHLVPKVHLKYVSSKDNPSDLLTRGVSAHTLKNSLLWWEGPSWLPHQILWPEDFKITVEHEGLCAAVGSQPSVTHPILYPVILNWERYGTYNRASHVMAWIMRFVRNLRNKIHNVELVLVPYIKVGELRAAESELIMMAQRESYPTEYHHLTDGQGSPTNFSKQLGLYSDEGVLRCKGRLEMATFSDNIKCPILLPKQHRLTTLIVSQSHKVCQHNGVGYVVAFLRQKWWIPQMRQTVRNVHRKCITCKKLQGLPYSVNTVPPLPKFRVQQLEPFQVTGVDYTGALQVKDKGGAMIKIYIVLFTCAVTRGIHLEVVTDLSCDSFLHAFRRFSSRRGYPQIMLSDNATTFASGAKFLRDLMNQVSLRHRLSDVKCEWRFIPARAPWFGAIWERLIGTLKSCMKKVLGRAVIEIEELKTVLLELEATINDRPLGYVYGDLDEPQTITPSQLISGRRLRSFPQPEVTERDLLDDNWRDKDIISKRYKYICKLSNDLWKRWTDEYLLSLRESHRTKRSRHGTPPQIGDIVLIHDEGPRLMWKLGRIVRLYHGPDGQCRVVQLRTGTGLTTRPIVKLYPVEGDCDNEPVPDLDSTVPVGNVPSSRPSRQAALGSSQLWRTMIKTGQL